ncbi:Methyltransferase type 11 [Cyanobacterium stanieri PCC 7202]|uniref:Methyltransferase type 11 n=1 Tax=Cyanobacterium stanieri (strain ATCC 29140 / PCC 7202) TaxID=292563 RepID=K9YJ13_CYASC|nr:Methyltransferase type 11 [Cyanobacterium stanieri PCC 7202]
MTTNTIKPENNFSTTVINTLLGIKPLANFAKSRARKMIISRAETIGVNWYENIASLESRDWSEDIAAVENKAVDYPEYYFRSFHAYDQGNLEWKAAWELESAAYSVHSTIFSKEPKLEGDRTLRRNYHKVLEREISENPQNILDMGCGVGLSTFALQEKYPDAKVTGLDLSPYFLAVAKHQAQQKNYDIQWHHNQAENTHLSSASFDLVSHFLMFHELPQFAAKNILQEAHRLIKTGGYLGIMDMNPQSEAYQKMPRYVLTLLKSTEPYLDQYFSLDIEKELLNIGFEQPKIIPISKRHRAIVARKK